MAEQELAIGTVVRYWTGCRDKCGTCKSKVSRTRTPVQKLASGTPVVWVEGEGSCIAMTHVDPVGAVEVLRLAAAKLRESSAAPQDEPTAVLLESTAQWCEDLGDEEPLETGTGAQIVMIALAVLGQPADGRAEA